MEIGQRVRTLRISKGLTQYELADILKIGKSTMSQYETGARALNDDMKIQLADFFGVTVDYLLGQDEKKESTPVIEDGLSEKEQQLLSAVRGLTPVQQMSLIDFLKTMLEPEQ